MGTCPTDGWGRGRGNRAERKPEQVPTDGPPWGCPGSPWHPVEPDAPRPTCGGVRGRKEEVLPRAPSPASQREEPPWRFLLGCPSRASETPTREGGPRDVCGTQEVSPPPQACLPMCRASVITCAPGLAECGLSPRHLPTQSRMYVGPSPSAPHPLPSHWDGLVTPGHPHQLQSGGRASVPLPEPQKRAPSWRDAGRAPLSMGTLF